MSGYFAGGDLRTWYRRPEQEFLQKEIQWFIRWGRRPLPLACLIFIATWQMLLPVSLGFWHESRQAFFHVSPFGIGTNNYLFTFLWPPKLIIYGGWILLVQKRLTPIFQQDRLRDIHLSLVNPRDLWPSLLMAPVLWFAACRIVSLVSTNLFYSFDEDILRIFPYPEGVTGPTVSTILMLFGSLLELLCDIVCVLALTAFTARWSAPKGGLLKVLVLFTMGMAMLILPERLVFGLVIHLVGMSANSYVIWSYILSPANLVVAAPMLYFSLRSLRGGRAWERTKAFEAVA